MSDRCSRILAEVHHVLLEQVGRLGLHRRASERRLLLDVGCWDGEATLRYAGILGARPLGIEIFPAPAQDAIARGVEVARLDLETDPFPWPDCSVDLVIANQVLEHLKNVWRPMSEMYRVLAPGGVMILSVPNLASLHNRVLLGLGGQPTSIRTFGPHVRGFTRREFERFVTLGGALGIERSIGVGFHPFWPPWTRVFSRLWPGGSHTLVVVARKLGSGPPPWNDYLESERAGGVQTFYRD
jgi:SAM-dependent methyltransferase